jgi:hypothetical protein
MNKIVAGLIIIVSTLLGFNAYAQQPQNTDGQGTQGAWQPVVGHFKEIIGTYVPELEGPAAELCKANVNYYYDRFLSCFQNKQFCSRNGENDSKGCYKVCAHWMMCYGPLGKTVDMGQ